MTTTTDDLAAAVSEMEHEVEGFLAFPSHERQTRVQELNAKIRRVATSLDAASGEDIAELTRRLRVCVDKVLSGVFGKTTLPGPSCSACGAALITRKDKDAGLCSRKLCKQKRSQP